MTLAGELNSMQGNSINTTFQMDDGSTLRLWGSLSDVSLSHVDFTEVWVTGGKCDQQFFLEGMDLQK